MSSDVNLMAEEGVIQCSIHLDSSNFRQGKGPLPIVSLLLSVIVNVQRLRPMLFDSGVHMQEVEQMPI